MATTKLADISFNPCFNGTYSLTRQAFSCYELGIAF